MAKRKRLDGSAQYAHSEEWQQQQQQPSNQYAAQALTSSTFGSSAEANHYASSSATGLGSTPHDSASAGVSALTEHSDPSQWSTPSRSRYPDVASHAHAQQPYFFLQTDPSTYNSPWPPGEAAGYASQSSNYPAPPPATTMPYFPPSQAVTEPSESALDTAVAIQPLYQNYQAEIDAPSQYAYVQNPGANAQARTDAVNQNPAFLYEDASIHLKIQSLPILENLVCLHHLDYDLPYILIDYRQRNSSIQ